MGNNVLKHTQRHSSWSWSKVNDQILSYRVLLEIPVISLLGLYAVKSFLLFMIIWKGVQCMPVNWWQTKQNKNPALNSLFDSGLGLFSKRFPICCLGLPVWLAHLFLVMSQYSSFHYYASLVVGVSLVWGWPCACHAWSNSLFLHVVLL